MATQPVQVLLYSNGKNSAKENLSGHQRIGTGELHGSYTIIST